MNASIATRFSPYPLTFGPILQERVWGGRNLERLGKRLSEAGAGPIGESWELSDVDGAPSVVAAGTYAGANLRELVERYPEELIGDCGVDADGRFPLLIKLLDAQADLSVQIHPSDEDLRAAAARRSLARPKRG